MSPSSPSAGSLSMSVYDQTSAAALAPAPAGVTPDCPFEKHLDTATGHYYYRNVFTGM
jgi:hypothetical protein